jgi:hypothetical protein
MRRGFLRSWYNALLDFVIQDRPKFDPATFEVNETVNGRLVNLSAEARDLLRQFAESLAQAPANPGDSATNIFQNVGGGGDGGTGLPDTGTDEEGNPTAPGGQPLAWNEIYVCISDGDGGWTPAVLKVYGALFEA